MQTNWSLNEIYTAFDSREFLTDIKRLDNLIKDFNVFGDVSYTKDNDKAKVIRGFLKQKTQLGILMERLADYCILCLSTDSDNRQALFYLEHIENKLTETTEAETKFIEYLKNSKEDLDDVINRDNELADYSYYIKEAAKNGKYLLSEAEERLIAKMETTGSLAWIKNQENVMANLTAAVEVNGKKKKLPFPIIRNMAYHKDEAVRKSAYEAELAACEGVAKSCCAALNAIKGEVITVCGLRGYDSPLEMTLIRSRMDNQTLNILIESIKENLSIFNPYFKRKAKLLGKDTLPFYDLFAPLGEQDFSFTYEEAADFVTDQFSSFSKSLGDYAKKAIKSGWIDVYPKEGKRDGAFCQNLHYLKESRVLLNFTGSFNDVLTLAHELGHGYHGQCLSNEAYLNSDYPMPIAETASILCESIVIDAALNKEEGAKAIAIMENNISSCAQVIVDILSRFMFESELFERRKNGSLSKTELCELMERAQIQAYGNGLDHNCLHKYMWVVKPHYYSAHTNYYNFPYAFGLLFSNGLYARYLDNKAAYVNKIEEMLSLSGKMNLKDTAAVAGIDLTDKGFWQESFNIIRKDIENFLAITE